METVKNLIKAIKEDKKKEMELLQIKIQNLRNLTILQNTKHTEITA
jgi:hypothetical protein